MKDWVESLPNSRSLILTHTGGNVRLTAIALLLALIAWALTHDNQSCDELIVKAWHEVPAKCRNHPEIASYRHATAMLEAATEGVESYRSMDSLKQAIHLLTRADSVWPEDADVDSLIRVGYEEMMVSHPASWEPVFYFLKLWEKGERDTAIPYLTSLVRSSELRYQQLAQEGFARGDTLACLHFHLNLVFALDRPIAIYEEVSPLSGELPRLRREQAGVVRELATCSSSAREIVIDKLAEQAYTDYLLAGRTEEANQFANFIGIDSAGQVRLTRESRRVSGR